MLAVLYIGGGYLALIGLMFVIQDKLLYHPVDAIHETPSSIQVEWEDVYFTTGDGVRLNGWYLPHDDSEYVVIFSHGNAGNISRRLHFLEMMNASGISVFIYDYRGFGKSEGTPDEKGLYKDIEAAWEYLTMERSYDPSRIILFGRSLGGSVSAYLAQHVQPAGLVLESAFTTLEDVASEAYPIVPSRLVRSVYPTVRYLSQTSSAVMIMHSREDRLIGFHHGRELYEQAPDPKIFVELRGGHNNNFVESRAIYFKAWQEFLLSLDS